MEFSGSLVSGKNLLRSSVNGKGNPPHPLTALLFGVMVTIVGWAIDTPLQYKAQLSFPPGFSTPRLFSCPHSLSFREARLSETELPRIRALGSSVNRSGGLFLCSLTPSLFVGIVKGGS